MTTARTRLAALVLALAGVALGPVAGRATAPLDHWVRELESADPEARAAACRGLALLGRDAAGEAGALLRLVGDPSAAVRLETFDALLGIHAEGDAVAAAAWASQAGDSESAVRRHARRLARKLGAATPAAGREMRRGLASPHADARKASAERLGRAEDRRPEDVASLLALALDDSDKGVRSKAIASMEQLGSPLTQHQRALRERLETGDDETRLRAAELLGRAAPLESASLSALAEVLLATDQPRLRRAVLAPLADHPRPHEQLAGRFLGEIEGSAAGRAEAAVLGLGALGTGSRAEVETLLTLRGDRDAPRSAALKALIRLASERGALPHVVAALDSPAGSFRIAAAEVLAGVGEPARSATDTLARLAGEDADPSTRSAALKALTAVATPDLAKPILLEASKTDRSSDVRSTARVQLKVLARAEARARRQ